MLNGNKWLKRESFFQGRYRDSACFVKKGAIARPFLTDRPQPARSLLRFRKSVQTVGSYDFSSLSPLKVIRFNTLEIERKTF